MPIYDDAYHMMEALEVGKFECVKFPGDFRYLKRGTMVSFLQLYGSIIMFITEVTEMIRRIDICGVFIILPW